MVRAAWSFRRTAAATDSLKSLKVALSITSNRHKGDRTGTATRMRRVCFPAREPYERLSASIALPYAGLCRA